MQAMTESQMDEEAVTADQDADTASTSPSSSATELSTVWTGMPRELVCMVVERSDRETLHNWTQTNKFYYNVAADVIWDSFKIYDPNPARVWFRIDALRCKLPFQTKSPAQRVRTLTFSGSQVLWRLATETTVHSLTLFTDLQRIVLEGHVPSDAFDALKYKIHLKDLKLRLDSAFLPSEGDDYSSYTLKFVPLAGLTHLQHLAIGRFTPFEAPGLAKAISNLPLIKLTVFAAPPADLEDPRKSYAGTEHDKSPIQTFLESSLADHGKCSHHLPFSLQDIKLQDVYRPFKSTQKDLLLNTVCPLNVSTLDLGLVATKELVHFFDYTRLPKLTSFTVSGCRHFLPETAWAALGLNFDHNPPVDLPDIPVHGSFVDFLRRHRQSLEHLTIRPVMRLRWPGDQVSLNFTKEHLERLGQTDQRSTLQISKPVVILPADGKPLSQEAWNLTGWVGSCSQRPISTFSWTCFCKEMEHFITMRFIERRDGIFDANLGELGSEDEDDDEAEDEDDGQNEDEDEDMMYDDEDDEEMMYEA
ncbi:MAG: hypothetical protein Q9192_007856 [Flavoplaca navasiana]